MLTHAHWGCPGQFTRVLVSLVACALLAVACVFHRALFTNDGDPVWPSPPPPQAAMISNANYISQVTAIRIHSECIEKPGFIDTHLSYLPLAHIFEQQCMGLWLSRGAEVREHSPLPPFFSCYC